MNKWNEDINGHNCAIECFKKEDGTWRCEITSYDRKSTGDGVGEDKEAAVKAAREDFINRVAETD